MDISLEGWDIARFDDVDWMPWGSGGNARAKLLAVADGFNVAYVEAQAGYRGDPHEHGYPEFLHVISGTLRNQGVEMTTGDSYAAATGSTHADFATDTGATYISIFKI